MRLVVLLWIAAAAAAADHAPLPKMSAEAFAAMVQRGDEQLQAEIDATMRPKVVTTARVKAQRAEVAALEQRRGKVVPDLEDRVGSAGHLAGAFIVLQVLGPTAALVQDLNDAGRVLWVDGVPTETMVDGRGFACEKATLFEIDSTKTYPMPNGATRTVLHARAVVAP